MQSHTPTYVLIAAPVLAGWVGLSYVLGDPVRTSGASFQAARALAPMWVWGTTFLVGATALVAALVTHGQRVGAVAYFIGGVVYAWWSACFALQALTDQHASLVAWVLYAVISTMHFVVARRCWVSR